MREISKEEHEYNELLADYMLTSNPYLEKLAMEKINKFEKEHPVLVDEIQSRRWIE